MVAVSSWGRLGLWEHDVRPLYERDGVAGEMACSNPGVAYGMGRSYGDAALNPDGALWNTCGLDRFIRFDPQAGTLTCESGTLLADIQKVAVRRGWMLPVTPGTWEVTVGGAIANAVHGKNHHRMGAFGDHVCEVQLARSDGSTLLCGPELNADWFAATVGGLGLTGVITTATLQLRRVGGPWVDVETLAYRGLDEFFRLADESERDWEYTVSWVDCLSGGCPRGVFFRGNHAPDEAGPPPRERRLAVPLTPPLSLVNGLTLRPANALYYHLHRARAGMSRQHFRQFFYPLDGIAGWNRLYGPRGFYQYQCVLPPAQRQAGTARLLDVITRSRSGSCLAVLKTFGERQARGMLSFPRPGVTLALDFPNAGDGTLALFERLDAVVREAGGRIYPAKDARMPRDLFESGYPRLAEFLPYRDPGVSSGLSRRLLGS